ncbi:hypothetical protein PIB30_115812, partial [Stylosanthes scabra]|nr:hypothetical protein [Stylosanthes scabra]
EVSTHMRELPRICVEALSETWDWRSVAHVIRESSRIMWALWNFGFLSHVIRGGATYNVYSLEFLWLE